MPKTKQITSIHRAAAVLKVLAQGYSRVEDIHQQLDFGKSTTHRFLNSLAASGLAYQDPVTRGYHVGPLVLTLSSDLHISHKLLILCAENELRRLNEITGESVLLFVPFGLQRVLLKQVPSPHAFAYTYKEGYSTLLHVASAGKILLSMAQDVELKTILRLLEEDLASSEKAFEKEALMKEIGVIRRQNYAVTFGESQDGTAGISVPIRNYICPVALCVVGPQFRFTPLDFLEEIRESGSRISRKLRENSNL